MAPMEPWERVWIDAETYSNDVHAYVSCIECHGGQAVDDMEAAHEGFIPDPAADPETGCGSCHPDIAPYSANSLHSTLAGYDTAIYARSAPEDFDILEHMEQNHCEDCHATCGDCHISQPDSVGGGLLEGHAFVETPPMSRTCTACHGSRVKDEYYGAHEGIPADVHFRARMSCEDCHTANEMHGVGMDNNHRYDGEETPACESCHQDQVGVGSGIPQHEVHGTEILSCQVCHSTSYTNCINCHVDQTDTGIPFYSIEEHFLAFEIGQNPERNAERPYKYVPLRHVPVDIDSFSLYGDNLLSNFDNRETWVYATPHNIQLHTPQNESCMSCHGNDEFFLTIDDVAEEERAANAGVIVDAAPPLPEGYEQYVTTPAEDDTAPASSDDGFWGEDTSTPAPSSDDDAFWGDDSSSAPAATPTSDEDAFWGDSPSTPEATTEPSEDDFWSE